MAEPTTTTKKAATRAPETKERHAKKEDKNPHPLLLLGQGVAGAGANGVTKGGSRLVRLTASYIREPFDEQGHGMWCKCCMSHCWKSAGLRALLPGGVAVFGIIFTKVAGSTGLIGEGLLALILSLMASSDQLAAWAFSTMIPSPDEDAKPAVKAEYWRKAGHYAKALRTAPKVLPVPVAPAGQPVALPPDWSTINPTRFSPNDVDSTPTGDTPPAARPSAPMMPDADGTAMVTAAFTAATITNSNNPITIVSPVVKDGDGWSVVVDLPKGMKASAALGKREELAGVLDRDEIQVILERVRGKDGNARRLRLWVADDDPYDKPPVPSPLAAAIEWNLWQPIPVGLTARRQPFTLSLVWTSILIGSLPRMGKTAWMRIILAAGALDPHVRVLMWDGKGGKDHDPVRLFAYRFGKGPSDEATISLHEALIELNVDMNDRYERLGELPDDLCPEGKVTPEITRNPAYRMPLTLVAIDEIQRYLDHKEYGKKIREQLEDLAKVGPAVGIILVVATQRPDSKTIEASLRDVIGTRIALKVPNPASSNVILGEGMVGAGADASKLLRSHKGVGIIVGADDGPLAESGPQTVRGDYIDLPPMRRISERGKRLREEAGTLAGDATGETVAGRLVPPLLFEVREAFRVAGDPEMLPTTAILDHLTTVDPDAWDRWDRERDAGRYRATEGGKAIGRALPGLTTVQLSHLPGNPRGYRLADVLQPLKAGVR